MEQNDVLASVKFFRPPGCLSEMTSWCGAYKFAY